MSERPKPELAEWPVEKLKKHPKQDEHFGRRSQRELEALAELIRCNGMDPIDITPAGVVLSGHQRLYIARYMLKWLKVPVRVRHDLAFDGPAAEEQYFIVANDANRQMSKLHQVRNCERAVELETQRVAQAKAKGLPVEPGRVRDRVGKLYKLNGRTLADWLPILRLPRAIQDAVEDKRLTRAQAMRILAAPDDVQQKIAAELAEHKTPAKVLKCHLGRPMREPLTRAKMTRYWRDVKRIVSKLKGNAPECFAAVLPEHRIAIKSACEFLQRVLDHVASLEAPADEVTPPTEKLKLKLKPKPIVSTPRLRPKPK